MLGAKLYMFVKLTNLKLVQFKDVKYAFISFIFKKKSVKDSYSDKVKKSTSSKTVNTT